MNAINILVLKRGKEAEIGEVTCPRCAAGTWQSRDRNPGTWLQSPACSAPSALTEGMAGSVFISTSAWATASWPILSRRMEEENPTIKTLKTNINSYALVPAVLFSDFFPPLVLVTLSYPPPTLPYNLLSIQASFYHELLPYIRVCYDLLIVE